MLTVVLSRAQAELAVLSCWYEVLGWGEGVRGGAKLDSEVAGRLGAERCKTRVAVSLPTAGREKLVVGSGWNVDEGGAGVDDTSGRARQGGGTVGKASDGDTPVWRCGAAGELREVGEGASVLGGVHAAKGQLAVGVAVVAPDSGLKETPRTSEEMEPCLYLRNGSTMY